MKQLHWGLRGTGRTSRMIENAIEETDKGRAVYVVTASLQERNRIKGLFMDRGYPNMKVETAETLGSLDWRDLSLMGAHPNCLVVVDHYAIESKFAPMLKELHRYDADDDSGKQHE